MIIKAVSFFLIGMLVLAMFGKLRFPGRNALLANKCKKCGRYKIGKKDCDCSSGRE